MTATQDVLDPRRLGKQNSGFSDDDIADIICLLLPCSEGARTELRDMALRTSHHIVDAEDAAHPNLKAEDGSAFNLDMFEHALVLRLSAQVKDPLQGFTFGRNSARCDVCFLNDPMRRLSNMHFRIHLNDYGVLMLEDTSTNGTVVDGTLLKGRQAKPDDHKLSKQRTINSGSIIKVLSYEDEADLSFLVRVPHREGAYEEAYRRNLTRYMSHIRQLQADNAPMDAAKTITPGPGGHVSKAHPSRRCIETKHDKVDLFPVNETRRTTNTRAVPRLQLPQDTTQEIGGRLSREWTGSEKYNRVGRIGKGAFATVYQVTHKFDGRPYAAKELDKRKFMKNGVLDQKVENEMNIMKRVKHVSVAPRSFGHSVANTIYSQTLSSTLNILIGMTVS